MTDALLRPRELETRLQDAGRLLVQREVGYCISSLVSTLAEGYGNTSHASALNELAEQAMELASSIDDYDSAALEAGWKEDTEAGEWTRDDDGERLMEDTAQEACARDRIEPHSVEVCEHWIVSDWLARKLEGKGEKVDRDFAGLTIWARTTTGQAICLDGVIHALVTELGWDKELPAGRA